MPCFQSSSVSVLQYLSLICLSCMSAVPREKLNQ
uniref:Uncharacterized protein n=1 Tax=Anguilla anguilla TaxID=7936 RepID=A0A0E9STU7_ANGAN